MLRENDPLYDVCETAEFTAAWRDAIRNGYINPMVAGSDLAGIKQLLAENPRRVPLNADFVSDLRVITYQGRVRIWYYIVEDDRTVYLERVTIVGGQ